MEQSGRKELGNFLRSRRNRLSHVDAGIISYGRRRTKGLKREEIAQLAGISLTWYTWIEQGREINFSVQVLANILRALELLPHEQRYAFELCGFQFDVHNESQEIAPSLQTLVNHQEPFPAYILGRYWQVVYINQSALNLFQGFDDLSPERRNIIWYTFVCENARKLVHQWELRARRLIAEFRADCRTFLEDEFLVNLLNDLRSASPEFNIWWEQHDVHFREENQKIFHHPEHGILTFNQHTFKLTDASNLKLVIHVPPNTS